MGAWIEIAYKHLLWCHWIVAPLVGAWIEMYRYYNTLKEDFVAPLVGAWIEIKGYLLSFLYLLGRTPRGCVD